MPRPIVSGWLGCILLGLSWLGAMLVASTAMDVVVGASIAFAADEGGEVEAATTAEKVVPRESMLKWLFGALGWFYSLVFLILTFNLVALVVMNLLAIRRDAMVPPALAASFEAHLNEKRYQDAYELAKNDESFLGQVLAAGMLKLQSGYEAAMAAMQEAGEEQNMRLEQRAGWIALIAQVAPMFGLLGTVQGMVQAFEVIRHSTATPKPADLAAGIGTALVTTVVGLLIAIPSIAVHHYIRNRIVRLVYEAGVLSEELMKRFSGMTPQAKKG